MEVPLLAHDSNLVTDPMAGRVIFRSNRAGLRQEISNVCALQRNELPHFNYLINFAFHSYLPGVGRLLPPQIRRCRQSGRHILLLWLLAFTKGDLLHRWHCEIGRASEYLKSLRDLSNYTSYFMVIKMK